MSIFDRARNRFLVPGFLINSLPKAGTHLLTKAVRLFPGIGSSRTRIIPGEPDLQVEAQAVLEVPAAYIGVDWPRPVAIQALQQALQSVGGGRFVDVHLPYSEEAASVLVELGMKSILILRDPRDVVVSHADYVAGQPGHFLRERYVTLSDSERLTASILGIEQTEPGAPRLLSILERCDSVLPWVSQSFNYTTYFEKLVGPQGGGSHAAQIQELRAIAKHLGIRCSDREVGLIASNVFGGTHTFRQGRIGGWRGRFSPEHKRVFKELAGQLLVELGYERDYDW